MSRTTLLFIYSILSIYCFGACMMDYFAIYEAWKLIDAKDFPVFHTFQGNRIIAIFVIPLGITTLFGLAACLFPVKYIKRQWLWYSMLGLTVVWILSFAIQIPIQLELNLHKDIHLLNRLLYTNWFRYLADVIQVIFVLIILWQMLQSQGKHSPKY
jgi:protein-S-isoprenylcysteine O-methyltransferase Ste14